MSKHNTPAVEIEKHIFHQELEDGIQAGMEHKAESAPQQREDTIHNTKKLLSSYRRIAYAVQVSESDLNTHMELEHGMSISTLQLNAELAGIDLSGTRLEGYTKSVLRSKNMLQIIRHALDTVHMDPEHGDQYYEVLFLTYFSPKKPKCREEILDALERSGYAISLVTYHRWLNAAIRAFDKTLWGYTARDCMNIIRDFLP